ncbi:MAG: DUF4386 domain-containing protein [Sphingobacteriaceae bacterium]|nr:DUF4386 domain-containing protein [Sphingobacteriaceae bacterium]
MNAHRKTSLAAGIFYLLTFVSIPTISLYSSVRGPGFITGNAPDGPVFIGIILEMIVALTGIGTAVALYPVLKRQNEGVAMGFVGSRVLEAATIYSGIVSLLSIVSLRQAGTGTIEVGQALVAQYNSTFLFGQSLLPAVNAVLLGYLMYRSRLIPRVLPVLGFIGAVMLVASWACTLLGYIPQVSPQAGLMAAPIALWEFSLGLYLVIKGFKYSAILGSKNL